MYISGVSTRKVSRIVEELCGRQASSSTVSRSTAQLDEELERWRQRPLGECPYLILIRGVRRARHARTSSEESARPKSAASEHSRGA